MLHPDCIPLGENQRMMALQGVVLVAVEQGLASQPQPLFSGAGIALGACLAHKQGGEGKHRAVPTAVWWSQACREELWEGGCTGAHLEPGSGPGAWGITAEQPV